MTTKIQNHPVVLDYKQLRGDLKTADDNAYRTARELRGAIDFFSGHTTMDSTVNREFDRLIERNQAAQEAVGPILAQIKKIEAEHPSLAPRWKRILRAFGRNMSEAMKEPEAGPFKITIRPQF